MSTGNDRRVGETPPLFGVIGFQRQAGMTCMSGVVEERQSHRRRPRRRRVTTSWSVQFSGADGSSITVTTHLERDDQTYDSGRVWASISAQLDSDWATEQGREAIVAAFKRRQSMHSVAVEWKPITIPLGDQDAAFELGEHSDGWWVAIGRVPGAIVTLRSQAVPLSVIRLEPIEYTHVPPLPDLGPKGETVKEHLDRRWAKLPFSRIHRSADYWALHSVEAEHIQRLGHEHRLSDEVSQALEEHWLARLRRELEATTERFDRRSGDLLLNSAVARRLRGRNPFPVLLFQLWFNTVGPGARCWFGNRHSQIRHHTFRLRWRP